MQLCDVRDYIATLNIAEDDNCYMGKLDSKKQKSIGCYILNRAGKSARAIGGYKSYDVYPISILIHWNTSPRQTEIESDKLYHALESAKEVTINEETIKFIKMLVPRPVSVDTDENGIYEMVVEAEIYYERR